MPRMHYHPDDQLDYADRDARAFTVMGVTAIVVLVLAILFAPRTYGQNQAYVQLRDGTNIFVAEGQKLDLNIAPGVNAPNGCPLHLELTKTRFRVRNGGIPDTYNYPATPRPQPLYFRWRIVRAPGRTLFCPHECGARNDQTLHPDDWILTGPDDPKNPARTGAIWPPAGRPPSPYTASHDFAFLDGGEGTEDALLDPDDLLELGPLDESNLAKVLDILGVNEDLIAAEPMAAKMLDTFHLDATCFNPKLPYKDTLEGWILQPENMAEVGRGGVWANALGGPQLLRTWYTGFCPLVPDSMSGMKPWYEAETFWWVFAARHWKDRPEEARLAYAVACHLTRRAVNRHQMRCDAPHGLKNAWRNEGGEWCGPTRKPDGSLLGNHYWPVHQISKAGSAATVPYPAKFWMGKVFAAATARPDDETFVDSAHRCVEYFLTNGIPSQHTSEQRILSNSLRNALFAYRWLVDRGDQRAHTLFDVVSARLNSEYALANPSNGAYAVDWVTATNKPGVTPFTTPEIEQMEGLLTAMVRWAQLGAGSQTTRDWIWRCVDWEMTHLPKPMGTATDGQPMWEWPYRFIPNASNWNGPPLVNFNGGPHSAYLVPIFPDIEARFPGKFTARMAGLQRKAYRDPDHCVANSGAISSGKFNWTSGGKHQKIECIGTLLRGAP